MVDHSLLETLYLCAFRAPHSPGFPFSTLATLQFYSSLPLAVHLMGTFTVFPSVTLAMPRYSIVEWMNLNVY